MFRRRAAPPLAPAAAACRRRRGGWRLLVASLLLAPLAALGAMLEPVPSGLSRQTRENLLAHLGTLDESLLAQPERLERRIARALDDALRPWGYYDARFTQRIEGRRVLIAVERGPRMRIAGARVEIDPAALAVPAIAAVAATAPFADGRFLSHPNYDAFRTELLETCKAHGFFDAVYAQSELRIDRAAHSAQPLLVLAAGPRYRFGELEVSGSKVRPALLQSLAAFRPGDPFDREQVKRFEHRLRDTAWFRDVILAVKPQPDATALVRVMVEDETSSRYELGAGYSTDSAIRLRFNRNSPLLDSAGHSFRIESEYSEPRQAVAGIYRIPHHDPIDDYVEITTGLEGENSDDSRTLSATIGLRHTLRLFGDWSTNYGISSEFERYSIGSDEQKKAAYLLPQTGISHTRLAPGIDPRAGHLVWSSVDFSDRSLGAPVDFLRLRGGVKWLFGLPGGNSTVLARAELGAVLTDAFEQVPASIRFHAGGDNSIRGYGFESISPRDASGKLAGGRYLAVGSLEISRRVRPAIRLAAFVDAGSAFDKLEQQFYQSVGVGVRWLSPFGQVRLDLAVPVKDEGNNGFRIHVSMGPPL